LIILQELQQASKYVQYFQGIALFHHGEQPKYLYSLWDAETILCHPFVNTSTLAVPRDGIKQFLENTGHTLRLVEVPVK
jgi:hypothetical protein